MKDNIFSCLSGKTKDCFVTALFNKTYCMNLNENQNVQLTTQNFKAIIFLLTDDALVCKFKHQRWREFRFMESTYLWYYPLYFDLYKNVAVKLNETCVLLCVQELKKNYYLNCVCPYWLIFKIDWLNKYETSHNKFCFFHFNKCWCTYLVLSDIPWANTPKRDFWTAVIEHSNIVSFNFKHATMSDRTISHISIEIIQRKWHEEIIRQVDSAWPFPDLVAGYLSIVQSDLKRSSCCCCKINYQRKGWKKTYKL